MDICWHDIADEKTKYFMHSIYNYEFKVTSAKLIN